MASILHPVKIVHFEPTPFQYDPYLQLFAMPPEWVFKMSVQILQPSTGPAKREAKC